MVAIVLIVICTSVIGSSLVDQFEEVVVPRVEYQSDFGICHKSPGVEIKSARRSIPNLSVISKNPSEKRESVW